MLKPEQVSATEKYKVWRCAVSDTVCFCVFISLFSSYKRYFYCHDVTGATRWDYPEGPEQEDRIVDDQQQRDVMDDAAQDTDTIEYQPTVPSSTNQAPAAENTCPHLPAEVFPGEPLPPGVDPPLPGALSADILALAGCPPPPPPMTPPDTAGADEIVVTSDSMTVENGTNQTSDPPVGSPMSDDEVAGSAIPDRDPEVRQNVAEISAPPMLNRPPSPQITIPSGVVDVECSGVTSPTADATATLSPLRVASPSMSSAADDTTTHQHRRKKKEKVSVTKGMLHQRRLKVKLENVAIANALQVEAARCRAVPIRFNFATHCSIVCCS